MVDSEHQRSLLMMIAKAAELSSLTQQPIVADMTDCIEQPNADNPRVRDLVDPITGTIVAQGGIERRVYEEGQRHARENNATEAAVGAVQRLCEQCE